MNPGGTAQPPSKCRPSLMNGVWRPPTIPQRHTSSTKHHAGPPPSCRTIYGRSGGTVLLARGSEPSAQVTPRTFTARPTKQRDGMMQMDHTRSRELGNAASKGTRLPRCKKAWSRCGLAGLRCGGGGGGGGGGPPPPPPKRMRQSYRRF